MYCELKARLLLIRDRGAAVRRPAAEFHAKELTPPFGVGGAAVHEINKGTSLPPGIELGKHTVWSQQQVQFLPSQLHVRPFQPSPTKFYHTS